MTHDVTGHTAGHVPVLLAEALGLLDPRPGDVAVDCTAGGGGHSAALARAIGPGGRLISIDLDPQSLASTAQHMQAWAGQFVSIRDSFVRLAQHLVQRQLRADVVLADLGFSASQMQEARRGFSFQTDGPLDMRYDPDGPVTAADLLRSLTEEELADLIRRYGEEPYAPKIARKLVQTRKDQPIQTTAQLVQVVQEAYGSRARKSRLHPATRTFMALRIAVNDELAALEALMDQVIDGAAKVGEGGWLNAGARVAIISFHSLEDRIVKRAFGKLADRGLGTRLTKRPITAGEGEVAANPRARSAKLRAVTVDGPKRITKVAPTGS
ncbi:MAG: 16S rRNA (cytosine(1402)-N(4))-methyltransferase RsmH [Phycisphaerales bacterium]